MHLSHRFAIMPRLLIPIALSLAAASLAQIPTLMISDCDDADLWKGATGSDEFVSQGVGSLRWEMAANKSMSITEIPHDWSGHNALAFDLYSVEATGSPIWLIVQSEDPDREGMDYYQTRIKLDFTGWRDVRLTFDEIGEVRHPLGWDHIERLQFHAAWNPNMEVDPRAVAYVDNVRLLKYSETGPRMTDEEFFDALDLDLPDLAQVQAAVARDDLEAAKSAWADYLRNRESPVWFSDYRDRPEPKPADKVNTSTADLALEHKFRWGGNNFDLGEDIDWSQNQMTEGESATIEWNARLNRHPMFQGLAQAWWLTGEEKYADKLVELMVDWIEDAPVLMNSSGNSPYHWAWETLNTACRTSGAWPDAIFKTLAAPAWTDEALVMVSKSMAEHARHLLKNPTSRNWLTAESTGLFYTGVLFPEYREAADWRRVAIERLYHQMDTEVYPDGPEDELALGYGMWVLRNYGTVLDFAILNDRKDEIPADWLSKIESMYNYVLYITMPDGIAPGLNDSGNTDGRKILKTGFGYFPQRTDFQWVATEGAEGMMPEHNSYPLPYCGHYIMRSGWDPDDLYMLLDAGPFGSGHQHEDKLTLIMYAHGRLQLVDGGSYMYDKSRWRRYVLGTRAHNTVMVDRLDQRRRKVPATRVLPFPFEPLGTPWVSEEDFDYVQGVYDSGYGYDEDLQVTHTRSVLFVKPDCWLVLDRMTPGGDQSHLYESLLHIDAQEAVVGEDLTVTSVTAEGESRLAIVPLPTDGLSARVVKGKEDEPVQGWSWATGGPKGAIPTAVYEIEGAGERTMCYVLWPLEADEELPIESIKRLDAEDASVVCGEMLLRDGGRRLFLFAPEAGKHEFGGWSTDAEVAFVSLDADGEVERSFMVGGSYLRAQ